MTIETTSAGVLALIAIMTVVTLVTRFGGVFLMSFVRINPRVESFINNHGQLGVDRHHCAYGGRR